MHSGHVEAAVAPVTLSSSRSRPDSRLPTGRPAAEGWLAATTAGYVWPGFQNGSARTVGGRVRVEAASVLRGRACVASGLSRLVRADVDGRVDRRLREVVEATGGAPLLAEAEAGALGGRGERSLSGTNFFSVDHSIKAWVKANPRRTSLSRKPVGV